MLNELLDKMKEKEDSKKIEKHKGESLYELVKLLGRGAFASLFIFGGSYLMAWGMTGETTPKAWGEYIKQVNTQHQNQYKTQEKDIEEKESLFYRIFYESEKDTIAKKETKKSIDKLVDLD